MDDCLRGSDVSIFRALEVQNLMGADRSELQVVTKKKKPSYNCRASQIMEACFFLCVCVFPAFIIGLLGTSAHAGSPCFH